MLSIIMYHYVRDLARSRFPRIKGRSTAEFDHQLDFIAGNFNVCAMEEVIRAARGDTALPDRACLLTFDDGLCDHYDVVFTRLRTRGWSGAFYPPVEPVVSRRLLDVHKLHFILAAVDEPDRLADEALKQVAEYRGEFDVAPDAVLRRQFMADSRFDSPAVVFLKRLLQHGLPPALRSRIVNVLFRRHVTGDEATFANQLYLSCSQLREMADAGMHVGGHGYGHHWMEHLSPADQRDELSRTTAFLEQIHPSGFNLRSFCFPYGSYNATTLTLLEEAGYQVGLTTRAGVNRDLTRPMELARLDTNDLPCRAGVADAGIVVH